MSWADRRRRETAARAAYTHRARQLRAAGLSYRAIGHLLGVSHTAVRKWLTTHTTRGDQ